MQMKTPLVLFVSLVLSASAQAQVLPNDAVVGGKTLSEWTAEWFKWTWLWPTNTHPGLDPDGRWATNGQPNGPVFFLTGTWYSGAVTRQFSIPEGKYVFFAPLPADAENIDTVPPLPVQVLRDE